MSGIGEEGSVIQEVMPGEMDLHSDLPTQAGVNKIEIQEIGAKHAIESTGPIEFVISSGSHQQIDPSGITMEIEVQILKASGKTIDFRKSQTTAGVVSRVADPTSYVIPINMIASTLFKDVDVRLNNEKISKTDGMYPYKAMLEAKVNCSKEEKEHSLTLGGFFEEDLPFEEYDAGTILEKIAFAEEKNAIDAHAGDEGWNTRWDAVRQSKTWSLQTPLFGDIFQQAKYLPPGSELGLTFTRHDPKFCLLSFGKTEYRVNIVKAVLKVKMVDIEEKMAKELEYETYQGRNMVYPLRRIEMTTFAKNANMQDISIENIVIGNTMPRRIFVALVNSKAFHGDYELDPFNFAHFSVREMALKINGSTSRIPPILCNYTQNQYNKALASLLSTTNCILGSSPQIGINMKNFRNRNVIYGFDPSGLGASTLENSYLKEERGSLGLNIILDTPLATPVHVIIFSEYDATMEIDKDAVPRVLPYA